MPPEQEALIRRVLGSEFLSIQLVKIAIQEVADELTHVQVTTRDGANDVETSGTGHGMTDALFAAMLSRYSAEYQSLRTISMVGFSVDAQMHTKRANRGADAECIVEVDVANSDGKTFVFTDSSRSLVTSTGRAVVNVIQFFVNAERAFIRLHKARLDAQQRGRPDLEARFAAEMSEVVECTSYTDVIHKIRNGA